VLEFKEETRNHEEGIRKTIMLSVAGAHVTIDYGLVYHRSHGQGGSVLNAKNLSLA
jgi:hypothetical protein